MHDQARPASAAVGVGIEPHDPSLGREHPVGLTAHFANGQNYLDFRLGTWLFSIWSQEAANGLRDAWTAASEEARRLPGRVVTRQQSRREFKMTPAVAVPFIDRIPSASRLDQRAGHPTSLYVQTGEVTWHLRDQAAYGLVRHHLTAAVDWARDYDLPERFEFPEHQLRGMEPPGISPRSIP